MSTVTSTVTSAAPEAGEPFVFGWAMFSDVVPLSHQRWEAVADLMDELRARGLVLVSSPSARVLHGARPVMELSCVVRPASEAERCLLAPAEGVAE